MLNKTKKTVICTMVVSIVMFGFCFAMVPIYKTYCKVTGINNALTIDEFNRTPDLTRRIIIEWIATNNGTLSWEFYPLKTKTIVHPGEQHKILFFVKNNSHHLMTVQAVPSFTPKNSAVFFHKIECFCFRQQTLKPGETKYMPVVFLVDKNIPMDIQTISLGYTLFDVTSQHARA